MEEKGKNGVNMKQQTPEVHPLTVLYTIFLEKGTPEVHIINEDDFINMHTNAPAVLVFDYHYCFNKRKLLIL